MRRAMLAIWSDVAPDRETDYLHWLAREHTAERIGILGFEAVRVLRAGLPGVRRFLILYDLADPAVLTSPAYLARLNDPTPWSRRIMPGLGRFARGGGRVLEEVGLGQGAHLLALRLGRRPRADRALLRAIAAEDRICAARLLDVDLAGTEVGTEEKGLRGGDESFPGLLLIEALDADALPRALSNHRDAILALGEADAEPPVVYSPVFNLRKDELPT